ncbi:uncharacterized protein LOC141903499 [Tubulanus polymorphus]|uniref:uncharacterized protein LOC141903499 n=1 Tax=Tubulanus polymorphus TaxID=672921 RepID=UPI003DA586E2
MLFKPHLQCPTSVNESQKFECIVLLGQGVKARNLEVDLRDGTVLKFYNQESTVFSVGTTECPESNCTAGAITDDHYLFNDIIRYHGTIGQYEIDVRGPGDFQFKILRPTCQLPKVFCFRSYSCIDPDLSQCSKTESVWALKCQAPLVYSFRKKACIDSAGKVKIQGYFKNFDKVMKTFETVVSSTEAITNTGRQTFKIRSGNTTVEPGDVIVVQSPSLKLGRLPVTSLYVASRSGQADNPYVPLNAQLMVRAHFLRALEVRFTHTYSQTTASMFNVTASVLGGENSTMTVKVLVPIRNVTIDSPAAAKTNETVTFSIPPHYGSDVKYVWKFSTNGSATGETTENRTTHSYSKSGTYNVSLNAVNDVSSDDVSKQIIIQDEVMQLTVNASKEFIKLGDSVEVAWYISQGTDVESVMTMEAGKTVGIKPGTKEPQQSHSGLSGTLVYTYITPGSRTVVVNATNMVSWQVANLTIHVQAPVGKLTMESPVNVAVDKTRNLTFTTNTGTELKFNATIDGVSIADVSLLQTTPTIQGKIVIPGLTNVHNYTLNLTVYNDISVSTAVSIVEVDVPFAGDTEVLSADRPFAPTTEDVNVTLTPVTATRVTVQYEFGDGTTSVNDWFESCDNTTVSTSHRFSNSGNFTIKATLKNPLGSVVREFTILVQHPVRAINFSSNSPLVLQIDKATDLLIPLKGMVGTNFIASAGIPFPTDPMYAIWVDDYNLTDNGPFTLEDRRINFTISEPGTYLVHVNISNLVSFLNYTHRVEADIKIDDVKSAYFDVNLSQIGKNLTFGATVIGGSRVKLIFEFQDGLNETVDAQVGKLIVVQHAFQTDGLFLVNVTAFNSVSMLSTTNNIPMIIQIPVRHVGLHFITATNAPIQEIPQGATYNAKFQVKLAENKPFPTNLTCAIDFGDGENVTDLIGQNGALGRRKRRSLSSSVCTIAGGCVLIEIPHVYKNGNPFQVRANLTNAVSQKSLNITANIYAKIVNLGFKIVYLDPYNPGLEKMRGGWMLNGKQNAYPTSYGIYGIATRDWGSHMNLTWKFGAKTNAVIYNNLTSSEQVFNTPQTITVELSASNVLNAATAQAQTIELRYPVGDINLIMEPVVIRNTTMTVKLKLGNNAKEACYYIDFKDIDATPCREYMYGDAVSCQRGEHGSKIAALAPKCKKFFTANGRSRYSNGIQLPKMKMMTAAFYMVVLDAVNVVSHRTLPIQLIVTRGPCYPPNVTLQIPDMCAQPDANTKYPDCTNYRRYPGSFGVLRSESLVVNSVPILNCTSSKIANYTWTIFKQENGEFVEMAEDELNGTVLSSSSLRMIYFAPRFFSYGNYRLKLNVSMHEEQGIFTVVSGEIFVIRTPLVVSIKGGYEATMKWFANVTVAAGELTYDPDDPDRDMSKLQFEWYCKKYCESFANYDQYLNVISEGKLCNPSELTPLLDAASASQSSRALTTVGCVKYADEIQYPGLMYDAKGKRIDTASFVVDTANWNEAFNIVLKLRILKYDPFWKDVRKAVVEQLVSVVNGDPPDIKMICVTNCQNKMNPSSRFSIGTTITNFPGLRDFGFDWTLREIKMDRHTISFNTIALEDWAKSVPTGVTHDYISIYPSVDGYFNNLIPNPNTRYSLLVHSWRTANPKIKGKASQPFEINDTPKEGICGVEPVEGTAIATEFNVFCSKDCSDPDGPLQYKIAYRVKPTDDPIWIYHGNNATMEKPSMLPTGLASNNYLLNVTLRCLDRLGALTDMFLSVKVLPPTPQTIANSLSKWSVVEATIRDQLAAANLAGFAQFIGLYGGYLNNEAARDDAQFNDYLNSLNQTFEAANIPPRNQSLIDRQKVREKYRELVVGEYTSITPPTIGVLNQLASALGVVTARHDELSIRTIELLYAILTDYCHLSIQRAGQVESSAEDIESVSRFLLAVVGNAAIGAGEVSKNAQKEITMYESMLNPNNKQRNTPPTKTLSPAEIQKEITKLTDVVDTAKQYILDLNTLTKSCMVMIVMQRKVPGEDPSVMTTASMSMSLEKRFSGQLSKKPITPGKKNSKDKIDLPNPSLIVGEGNETTYFVETKCLSISSNIYTFSNNTGSNAETKPKKVTSGLLSLDLRNETGAPMIVGDLPDPIVLVIDRKRNSIPDISVVESTKPSEDMLIHTVTVPLDATFGVKVVLSENATDLFNGTTESTTNNTQQASTATLSSISNITTSNTVTSPSSVVTSPSYPTSTSPPQTTLLNYTVSATPGQTSDTSSFTATDVTTTLGSTTGIANTKTVVTGTSTLVTSLTNSTSSISTTINVTTAPMQDPPGGIVLSDNITRFVVFVKVGSHPTVSNHDFNCTLPLHAETAVNGSTANQSAERDPNTCLFHNILNGTDKPVYVGIKAFNGTIDPANATVDDYMETLYNASFFTADCLFWDPEAEEWSNAGCTVGDLTTGDSTQCKCTHLTTFGSSFTIPLPKIDFSGGFLNPNDNPVVFGTMVSLLCLYLILLIWAVKADRKDLIRAGSTPLPDNDPRDKYIYEILVTTGEAKEAGTTAQVSFVLTGEDGDTGPRVLMDEKRKVLQKGDINSFIMVVPKPLGNLEHLRIWHDNGGKNPSWFFNQMQVTDIQTLDRFLFICDKWLAVEQEDGLIDRIIPLAGDIEMKAFNYLFWSKTRKDLSDGHIWLSVFKRPPKSNFTRVQRLTCCLTLVYVSMMASLTFYKAMAMRQNVTQIVIGPIKFTLEQLVVSILASLIIVPVNVFIVLLFRMSGPWPPNACGECRRNKRVCDSKYSEMKSDQASEAMEIELQNEKEYLDTGERKSATPSRRSWNDTQNSQKISFTDASGYGKIPESPKKEDQKKKKKKLVLPWWCVIVGHTIAFIAVAVSFYFANMFSKDLGLAGSKEWIASFGISLVQSIMLQQPIKVLFLALLYALIIKKPDLEEPDESEYDNSLMDNEEWLHDPYGTSPDIKEKIARYKAIPLPPDEEELKAARDKRLKEIEMVNIIWEIIFYTIFVGILIVLSYENRDTRSHYFYKDIENIFYNDRYTRNNSVGTYALSAVRNFDQFWDYAENSLVPGMFGYDMFPGDDWYKYKNYIVDRQALRVCVPRLRQLRTKPDPNDKPDYGFGYSSAWTLKGSPTSGKFATYSGGGYVVNLGTQPKQALRTLKAIKAGNWLDKNTRCIIIEFLLYNNNVRLYGVAFLLVEFLNSGGAFTKYKVTVMRLEKGMTPTNSVMFFFQFIFLGFLVYFAVRASKRLRKIGRRQYFSSFWDVYEFAVIFMGFVAIFMQIVRFFGAYAMAEMMTDRTKFINLDYVVLYDELSVYLLA